MAIMPFPNIDPIAFAIGPVAIHWYGLAYVAGIMLGWYYARVLAGNDSLWPGNVSPITRTQLDDFLVWAAVGVVLGGRIGYILFYDLARYISNPLDALRDVARRHVVPWRPHLARRSP
jgi:phosphatidylglycerol:prolipoprotein diacylglycerol transferase